MNTKELKMLLLDLYKKLEKDNIKNDFRLSLDTMESVDSLVEYIKIMY